MDIDQEGAMVVKTAPDFDLSHITVGGKGSRILGPNDFEILLPLPKTATALHTKKMVPGMVPVVVVWLVTRFSTIWLCWLYYHGHH
jgi:hypothetical protein